MMFRGVWYGCILVIFRRWVCGLLVSGGDFGGGWVELHEVGYVMAGDASLESGSLWWTVNRGKDIFVLGVERGV